MSVKLRENGRTPSTCCLFSAAIAIQKRIIPDTLKTVLRQGRRPELVIDINALARKVSGRYNVSIGELRSGGRRRAVVNARRAMSWIGVRELGYSGADIARYIGVTNSCVTRMISSGKKPEIDDINLDL